jgi:NaMN:DMB phosphoribosyltransferase
MGNSVFLQEKLTERNLIESILASHYIIDYGFIKKVNADKTVDVTHAKQLKTLDGKTLPATVTTGVEVLTIAGAGFSINFDYKKGDKVLLLGLKDYIPKVEEVTSASETTAFLHYTRETLKAIPLCVFNDKAKVQIKIEDGKLTIGNGSGVPALEVTV